MISTDQISLPRKIEGAKLEKVLSTTLSVADFELLKKYARIKYEANELALPTVSHMLRFIVKKWAILTRYKDEDLRFSLFFSRSYMGAEHEFY